MPQNRSRYAVLGALTVSPMSGYALRQFFAESVSYFWRESFGQIYPILRRLQREGLIRPQARERGPSTRTTYVITKQGRAALARWLGEPAELQPPRVELLLKLFFAREGTPSHALRLVQDFRRIHRERLATYETLGARIAEQHAGNPNLPNWLLTISYGEELSRAMMAWCDIAERKIRESARRDMEKARKRR